MNETATMKSRFGMVIDLDRCNGCGACTVACSVENNLAPGHPSATDQTGITWLRVYEVGNGEEYPKSETVFIPMFCQQCESETPCVTVCPQNAVEFDPETGIVGQIPQRCLGCRYCMTACPYHARSFNWRDPVWPKGMEQQLNPDVSPRMRGVAEKCNFCHGRLHAARAKAAAAGQKTINPDDYTPACVEACPSKAIVFGDLADASSNVSILSTAPGTFRFLEKLGTESKVYFHSQRTWVLEMAERHVQIASKEDRRG